MVNAYTAVLEAMRGRFPPAREKAARSTSILEDLGRRVTAAGACYFTASVELLADEPARAEEMARSALETLDALGETVNSAALGALLAEALCRQGKFDEAERVTETSERTAWPDDLHDQVGWRAARAQALAGRGPQSLEKSSPARRWRCSTGPTISIFGEARSSLWRRPFRRRSARSMQPPR